MSAQLTHPRWIPSPRPTTNLGRAIYDTMHRVRLIIGFATGGEIPFSQVA